MIKQWETLRVTLPPYACIDNVMMNLTQMQVRWQDMVGVLHQILPAHRSHQSGQDYGVLLKKWSLLQRVVFVIDREDRIVYAEYLADQMREPAYAAAIEASNERSLLSGA